jgi:hypothetical protein
MTDFENDASMYVQKMLDFYKVDSITKLSEIINISVPSISNWRKYNYIKAIKTKCKDIGIYREIFGDDMGTNVQKEYINYGYNTQNGKQSINTQQEHNVISIKLEDDLLQQLQALADKEYRPLDMQIKKMLIEALSKDA